MKCKSCKTEITNTQTQLGPFVLCSECFDAKKLCSGYRYNELENEIEEIDADSNIKRVYILDNLYKVVFIKEINELNIDRTLKQRERIYCGVEGSTCNKDLRYFNHSMCCLKCEHDCNGCTVVDVERCSEVSSKKQIALRELEHLTERKKECIEELFDVNNEIGKLFKEL